MKAETLKKSILQYAMQGKLVAQDPNDEPASELLKRIKAEKEQLIKDGKIKKEKPLPPITEEEIPYELPKGWEWVRLGEIGDWGSGSTPNKAKFDYYRNGTINWLKTGDLNDGYINEIPEKITEVALKETSVKIKPAGSLLIAMYGATIGRLGILNIPSTTNQACCACIKYADINIKYLFYYLLSERDNLRKKGEGGAQPNISREKIIAYLLPLPPLAEQQRIVEKLEEILPLVEEYGKNEEILSEMNKKLPKQIRQSILQYAVQGKLVPQNPKDEPASELLKRIKTEKEQLIKDSKIKKEKPLPSITADEIPFEIPKSWTWVYWNDLLSYEQYSMKRGPFGSALKKDFFVPKGIRVFEQYNAINDDPYWSRYYITKEKYEELKAFTAKAGDLLISCSGVTLGRITEIPDDADWGIINQALLKLKLNKKLISNNYFKMLFKSKYMQDLIFDKALGSAIPNMVGVVELKRIQIPLPPLAEQQRIVTKVEELMKIVDSLKV